jgi:hypothetical protein
MRQLAYAVGLALAAVGALWWAAHFLNWGIESTLNDVLGIGIWVFAALGLIVALQRNRHNRRARTSLLLWPASLAVAWGAALLGAPAIVWLMVLFGGSVAAVLATSVFETRGPGPEE